VAPLSERQQISSPKRDAADEGARPPLPDQVGSANLDKVRDILFGGQMRDFDRRLARLEERQAKDMSELKEDVRRRLAALEEFIKREAESLTERIKGEHAERSELIVGLTREFREATQAIDKRHSGLDDQLARAQREFRQQILEQYQRLNDEIRLKTDEVVARLDTEAAALRSDKADRATLATLLTEMAMRLTNDLSIPGFEAAPHE
jgi:hypothetical protein